MAGRAVLPGGERQQAGVDDHRPEPGGRAHPRPHAGDHRPGGEGTVAHQQPACAAGGDDAYERADALCGRCLTKP